jgi:hypothetical protein
MWITIFEEHKKLFDAKHFLFMHFTDLALRAVIFPSS